MNLAKLYEQQQEDIERFKAVRDKTWTDMQKNHAELSAAFGGKEKLPDEYRKRMDEQIKTYQKEWSMEGGERLDAIKEQHAKQREAITGKKSDTPEQAKRQEKDMITEKQKELKKIIAMQQAIKKKNEEKKRKR